MTDDADPRASLRRALGWPAVAAYGLGAILGAGIYSVIGAAAGHVGDAMWLAFALGAVVALLTALSYAELATMHARAGAEFLYVRHALPRPRVLAFTVGTMMAASAAATSATVAIAFAGYLSALVDAVPRAVVSPALIVVLAAVAVAGIQESTRMVAVFTCIEAAGLVVVVVLGATTERFGAAFTAPPTPAVISGAARVFFAYLGFENIANLAEETRQPERSLPRAIVVSLAISTALYVLVAVAAVALLPAGELARSDAPLADAVRARSSALAGALGGIALFATANTAMAAIVSGSRILYAMARAGELPAKTARVSRSRRTPYVATIVIALATLALLPLGTVAIVASFSSFASLLAFAAVNASLVILRFRDPDRRRPFRVPVAFGRVPVLPVLGAACALLLVTQLDRRVLAYGAMLLAALVVAYPVIRGAERQA